MSLTTLNITKADLNERNEYIGATDVSDFAGHIEIAADLGRVKFKASIAVKGRIRALAGSGISAGDGISAGSGISAGLSVAAKWIEARLRIFAGLCDWKLPEPEEMEIRAELRKGVVAFGTLIAPEAKEEQPAPPAASDEAAAAE